MDPIKEAFAKAKQDIAELRSEVAFLKENIAEIKNLLSNPTLVSKQQTNKQENTTHTLNEPIKTSLYGFKTAYTPTSIGNRGVPTNKQTNQQTDNTAQEIELSEVLETFDTLKENLKSVFKSLTKQEMSVFAAIYLLEEQNKSVDYSSLASKLGLTEISIRDYILKMTRKGAPIIKTKENNKKIFISIDPSLKKIASLSSILLLREPNID